MINIPKMKFSKKYTEIIKNIKIKHLKKKLRLKMILLKILMIKTVNFTVL
ncbi:hypothetical protein VBSAUS320_32 [Staphylococcus phage vB_SauS_320]|nr:hypothetical protein VBSAUS320_32 [Staphylococcus phage vB_SauS_320]